jgi:hypothetical protein
LGRFSRSACQTVSFSGLPLNSTFGVPTWSKRRSFQCTVAEISTSGGVAGDTFGDGRPEGRGAGGERDGDGDGDGEGVGETDGDGDAAGETEGDGEGGTGRCADATLATAAKMTAAITALVIAASGWSLR